MRKPKKAPKTVTSEENYGNLMAKYYWVPKKEQRIWKCKCLLCGRDTYVPECDLLSGKTTDCGCQNESLADKEPGDTETSN